MRKTLSRLSVLCVSGLLVTNLSCGNTNTSPEDFSPIREDRPQIPSEEPANDFAAEPEATETVYPIEYL